MTEQQLFVKKYVIDTLEYVDFFTYEIDPGEIATEINAMKMLRRILGEPRIPFLSLHLVDEIVNELKDQISFARQSIIDGQI